MTTGLRFSSEQRAGGPRAAPAGFFLPVADVMPLSTIDFPGQLAAVIFTQGCPWRCSYCYNSHLQAWRAPRRWRWAEVEDLLQCRRGLLQAVVFSGGEPAAHTGLAPALRRVRALGYLTGLHTAGAYPERLAALLPLLDWVGLDIKAPLDERYAALTGDAHAADKAARSLALVCAARVPLQVRTTLPDNAAGRALYEEISAQLRTRGAPAPVWQRLVSPSCAGASSGCGQSTAEP